MRICIHACQPDAGREGHAADADGSREDLLQGSPAGSGNSRGAQVGPNTVRDAMAPLRPAALRPAMSILIYWQPG